MRDLTGGGREGCVPAVGGLGSDGIARLTVDGRTDGLTE